MSTGRHAKSDYAEWLRMLHGKVNGTEDPSEARKVELAKDRIAFRPPPISFMAVNLLNRVIYSDVSKVRVNYFLLE